MRDGNVQSDSFCRSIWTTDRMMVRLGEHIFNTEDDGTSLQDIPIARAIIHEKYNDVTLRNDIALLVLKHKIKMAGTLITNEALNCSNNNLQLFSVGL